MHSKTCSSVVRILSTGTGAHGLDGAQTLLGRVLEAAERMATILYLLPGMRSQPFWVKTATRTRTHLPLPFKVQGQELAQTLALDQVQPHILVHRARGTTRPTSLKLKHKPKFKGQPRLGFLRLLLRNRANHPHPAWTPPAPSVCN
jgi:hypothetical protein